MPKSYRPAVWVPTDDGSVPRDSDRGSQVAHSAFEMYRSLFWRARLARWWAALTRRRHTLLSLEEVGMKDVHRGNQSVRICTVPTRQIRGSEGRTEDFDAEFRPLQRRTQGRWLRIATARLLGITLPPVELIQVADTYYVRDGNHRISVARAMGQQYTEAEVTIWESDELPSAAHQDWNCRILVQENTHAYGHPGPRRAG